MEREIISAFKTGDWNGGPVQPVTLEVAAFCMVLPCIFPKVLTNLSMLLGLPATGIKQAFASRSYPSFPYRDCIHGIGLGD